MARQRKQSGGLMASLGKKGEDALAAHRKDETRFSVGGDLPEGIDGGIAQLTECKFDKYKSGDNKGEYYFLAAGIVKEPSMVGNIPVRGLRTQIMEPVCDTPNRTRETTDEHFAWILNELRKLGVDTTDVDGENVEAVVELLKEEQPHFRFRTWKGEATKQFPKPRVQQTWGGVCEYSDDEAIDVDESPDAKEPEDSLEDSTEETDLVELAELADGGDDEATLQLTSKAEDAGLDPDKYATWSDVVEALEGKTDTAAIVPEKGEVYGYRPPRARKDVECEVTAVFAAKETCNLKNLDSGISYKQVPWSKLSADA